MINNRGVTQNTAITTSARRRQIGIHRQRSSDYRRINRWRILQNGRFVKGSSLKKFDFWDVGGIIILSVATEP